MLFTLLLKRARALGLLGGACEGVDEPMREPGGGPVSCMWWEYCVSVVCVCVCVWISVQQVLHACI